MRNITLRADERTIELARERARANRTTLNQEFRRSLEQYARSEQRSSEAAEVIEQIRRYARTGGERFSCDERNER